MRSPNASAGSRADRHNVKRRLTIEALCDRRVLAALPLPLLGEAEPAGQGSAGGLLPGVVLGDLNHSWRLDGDEVPLSGQLVFFDANDNGKPDAGEPLALTDDEGRFALESLGGDDRIVRLFTGDHEVAVHFPIAPTGGGSPLDLTASPVWNAASDTDLQLTGGLTGELAWLVDGPHATAVDWLDQRSVDLEFPADVTIPQRLPSGQWLILPQSPDASGVAADGWLFDPSDDSLQPATFNWLPTEPTADAPTAGTAGGDGSEDSDSQPVAAASWSAAAIDRSGNGFLVMAAEQAESAELWHLLGSESLQLAAIDGSSVSAAAELHSGGTSATLLAEPGNQELLLSLWSNLQGNVIGEPVAVQYAQQVISFSDQTGLVFLRVEDPELGQVIQVLDADAQLAPLQTLRDLDSLVAVDSARSVVYSLAAAEAQLTAVDALSAEVLGRWDVAEQISSDAGEPNQLLFSAATQSLLIKTATGIDWLNLPADNAHRLLPQADYPLRFAAERRDNTPRPSYVTPPVWVVPAGETLELEEGALLAGLDNPSAVPPILIRVSDPRMGTVVTTPAGGMTYTPRPGFVGTDHFLVSFHDGNGLSEPQLVSVAVQPEESQNVPITVQLQPLPEHSQPGFVVGTITATLPGEHSWWIADHRFEIAGNQIVVSEQGHFNYEVEAQILLQISGTDEQGNFYSGDWVVLVEDESDPITDILPRAGDIVENHSGPIAQLTVVDEDYDQTYVITVDDPRFEVVDFLLQLKAGETIDYEAEPVIQLMITASAVEASESLTVPFVLTVHDVPEQAQTIELSHDEVTELLLGAPIGTLRIDGNPLRNSYHASVNDSRFEIVDGQLKLRDDVYLSHAEQAEAEIEITVQDTHWSYPATTATFLITVIPNGNPFHHPHQPFDVDGDNVVTPLDALLVLNAMSQNGGPGPIGDFPWHGQFWDVNGDGQVTPLDALLILNYLNSERLPDSPLSESERDGEGEEKGDAESTGDGLNVNLRAAPLSETAATAHHTAADRVDEPNAAPRAVAANSSRQQSSGGQELTSTDATQQDLAEAVRKLSSLPPLELGDGSATAATTSWDDLIDLLTDRDADRSEKNHPK